MISINILGEGVGNGRRMRSIRRVTVLGLIKNTKLNAIDCWILIGKLSTHKKSTLTHVIVCTHTHAHTHRVVAPGKTS